MSIAGVIGDGGSGYSLTKISSGTLTLSGVNTYTGGTSINAGTLALSGSGSVSSSSSVNVAGIFDISGISGSGVAIGDLTGTGTVTLGSKGLTAGTSTSLVTFSGTISGSGSFTKLGTGTLVLSGTNTYTGTTNVNVGTLNIGPNGLGGGGVTLAAGTTLQAGGAVNIAQAVILSGNATIDTNGNAMSIGGIIQGSYSLTTINNGTLTLTAANTYSAGTTISAGTLALSGSGALLSTGTLNVNGTFDISAITAASTQVGNLTGDGIVNLGAKALVFNTAGPSTFSGTFTGTGGITKMGSGTMTISGTNTFNGVTTVSQGTLILNGSIAGSALVSSGALLTGTGAVNGSVVVRGTIAPGNSPGTMYIGGDFMIDSGSTLSIEISPTQFSLLDITGSATIDAGSHLQIVVDPGHYNSGVYIILSATDGVSGEFISNIGSILPGYKVQLVYTSNLIKMLINVIDESYFQTGSLSPNNASLFNYLLNVSPAFLGTSYNEFLSMSAGELNAAMSAISPARNSAATYLSQTNTIMCSNTLNSRFFDHRFSRKVGEESNNEMMVASADDSFFKSAQPGPMVRLGPASVWLLGFGEYGSLAAQYENSQFGFSTGGAMVGVDWDEYDASHFNLDFVVLGIAATYAHSSLQQSDQLGKSQMDAGYLALYGTAYVSDFFADFALWNGYQPSQ